MKVVFGTVQSGRDIMNILDNLRAVQTDICPYVELTEFELLLLASGVRERYNLFSDTQSSCRYGRYDIKVVS